MPIPQKRPRLKDLPALSREAIRLFEKETGARSETRLRAICAKLAAPKQPKAWEPAALEAAADLAVLYVTAKEDDRGSASTFVRDVTPRPSKRYADALAIQGGACNCRAIGFALSAAIVDAERERLDGLLAIEYAAQDPAVQLIIHQLAFLAGMGTANLPGAFDWDSAMHVCNLKTA